MLERLLKDAMLTQLYKAQSAMIVHQLDSQLSTGGLMLDLDKLPVQPWPFKEIFIRWLISINGDRIAKGERIIATPEIVLKCPLWKAVKPPFVKLKLTKEGIFNQPKRTTKKINAKPSVGAVNKK